MSTAFSGKTLMITGGTGSFGEAVLKRFLDTERRFLKHSKAPALKMGEG